MVQRSGFYVKDGAIMQRIVKIDWDLGFDRYAKMRYIQRLHVALGTDIGNIAEVTSASVIQQTRNLSPIFIKMKETNMSIEDYLRHLKENVIVNIFDIPGATDWIYLTNMSEENKQIALQFECYSDVFHNPEKSYGNTQALSLALFRLLHETNSLYVLDNAESYVKWYNSVCFNKEYV